MKIQIVNKHDEPIGVKERGEINYTTDIYRITALWLTNSKGQALLAKRSANKDKDPGKWGPAVAGTVDEGETYDVNIYKEAEEEIGLTGASFTKGPKMFVDSPRSYFCQWYFVTVDRDSDSFVIQQEEVDELTWVDVDTLKQQIISNPDKYVPAMPQIVNALCI